jgi:hypothetical protein
MDANRLFDALPLWAILPLTGALLLLSVELGYRFARHQKRHSHEETEATLGSMVGATLGLLAFMLAFTFGLAGTRFEARRQVVLAEANAIGTTYLRGAMLPEPMRSEARNLLREYVDARLEAVQTGKVEQGITKSEEIQNRLWSLAVAAAEKDRTAITSLFIQSLNEMIDLHATRLMAGLRSRVPTVIWIVLYLLAVLATALLGYHSGLTGGRRSIAVVALILAFSAVLVLIVDLDRPGEGMLRVSQQSMIDLRQSMREP